MGKIRGENVDGLVSTNQRDEKLDHVAVKPPPVEHSVTNDYFPFIGIVTDGIPAEHKIEVDHSPRQKPRLGRIEGKRKGRGEVSQLLKVSRDQLQLAAKCVGEAEQLS